MATTIEWTQRSGTKGETWNVVTGCDRVSAGCDNCYAMTMAKRLKAIGQPRYQCDGDPRTSGPGFGLTEHPDVLTLPLHWRKPRTVFVNSMSDLFHARVSREFLARVFAVMALTPQHTYQCLTKRPRRMSLILNSQEFRHAVARELDSLRVDLTHDLREAWASIPGFSGYEASSHGRLRGPDGGRLATTTNPQSGYLTVTLWNHGTPRTVSVHRSVLSAFSAEPDGSAEVCHRNGAKTDNRLANLRWGSRSENQHEKIRHGSRGGPAKLCLADVEEIRRARRGAGASRPTQQVVADRYGVSRSLISLIESGAIWAGPDLPWPLPNVWLGTSVEDQQRADERIPHLLDTPAAVRFLSCEPLLEPVDLEPWLWEGVSYRTDYGTGIEYDRVPSQAVDWVIVGAESGSGARPMDPAWAQAIVDQCHATGVPVFVKQLSGGRRANHDIGTFPPGLQVREYPQAVIT